jgi:chromosome segregation ATPase
VPELAAATASSAHLDADPSAHLASHLDELRMELSSQRAHIESMRAQLHAVETREATSSAQIKELRKELGSRNRIMKYVMRRSAASESHADESELAHMYVGSGTEPSKS